MQVSGIKHYPPSDFEPAASDLARFLWPGESWTQGRQRLLLGNGEGGAVESTGGEGGIQEVNPSSFFFLSFSGCLPSGVVIKSYDPRRW